MKWLLHLYRFWPLYLLAAGALTGAGWYVHHQIFESGFAASEAKWQPRFAQAERELAVANERAHRQEEESSRVVADSQKQIDEARETLRVRSADYDGRLRALSVRVATERSHRCEVPAASGATPEPDAATESIQRATEAGSSIAAVGADCEADSAALAEWQRFYLGLRVINQ